MQCCKDLDRAQNLATIVVSPREDSCPIRRTREANRGKMNIDTVHREASTIVEVTCTTDEERGLTDKEWKRVAFNQHRLMWRDCASGIAVLPRRLTGILPNDDVRVERDGDRISVIFPRDF